MQKITMFQRVKFCFQLFLIIVLTQIGYAQEKKNQYEIKTTIGSFEIKAFENDDFKRLTGGSFENNYFRLVQFYEIPTESQRKKWESLGMIITDYLSANTYYVVINNQFPITQLKGYVRAILPIDLQFKKEAALFFKGIPDHAKKADNKAQLILSYFKSVNSNAVINDLKSRSVQVIAHRDYSNQLDVLIDASQLDAIANLPYVQFIGAQMEPPIKEILDYRNATGRANFLNSGYNGLNYRGEGVVIGVGEGGVVGDNIDMKGRISEVGSSGIPKAHKIESTQNAVGAGNIDPTNKNNAWGATILSLDGIPNYSALYTSHNLRYTNHSYGYSISGGYDSSARNHDLRIATLPNHMVSYSSGNSGTETGFAPYSFPNWSNITGDVKQNKNQIAIGALNPNDQITGFSSRGPMYDGRIIPQLVTEGSEGTSFASPKVVGDIAILAQVYKDKNGGTEPSSSLLRAVIMNTADDLGNAGPDYIHGYGKPNLRRAYNIINTNQIITSSVTNGATNNHAIVIPANTKQVRVMVVWPDVAAAVNANPAIVNNLNITLISPSLTSYNPWVLDSAANVPSISAPATRGVDNLNTIEQVTLDNPDSGSWTISVNGFNVPSGPQTYYLVYEFLSDELQIVYPLQNEKFVPGQEYYLRWDSYGNTNTFNLAYELNNNGSWITIVNGYNASSRVYKWITPIVSGGINSIKFRVQRGALISDSGVNQIGKTPDNFRIVKVCNDIVTLRWSSVVNATSYKVYRLGPKYMEEVTANITFSGNSAILTGQSTTSSEYYAVSALTNTIESQRTIAVEKVVGDVNCIGLDWTGTISTDWFTTGNWASGSLPTVVDNVNILSTATFQPNITAVGAVCGNITINTGATLSMSSATAYILSVSNDWINDGTFIRGIGTVDFVGSNLYQEIGGSSTTNFNILKVTKGTRNGLLEANALITLNASTNPLSLVSGTFKLSSNSTISPFTSSISLSNLMGIWNNGGTINSGNFGWTLNGGLFRVSAGTTNIGTASGNSITYLNNPTITIEGGALNVAGRISPNSAASTCTTNINDGIITVNRVGTTSTTRAPFEMTTTANFTFTGGTLIIQRASSNTADYVCLPTTGTITGGTLQIGNSSTPVSQIIRVNSTAPIFNLTVSANNSPILRLITNNLTINKDLTIAGGTYDANGLNTSIRGNWNNNGIFIPNIGKVIFDGAINQKINGTSATTFKDVTLNNSLGITLDGSVNASIDGQLILTNGVVTTATNSLIITSNGSISRTIGHIFGNLQKPFSSTVLTSTFEIGDQTAENYTPIQVNFGSITTSGNLTATTIIGDYENIVTSTIDETQNVNRYWSIVNSGITGFTDYNATFNFVVGDIDSGAATNDFIVGKYDASSWTYPTVGTKTSTSTQAIGMTTFSAFAVGKGGAAPPTINTQPSASVLCTTSGTSFTASANSTPISTVIWEISTNGGGSYGTLTVSGVYSVNTTSSSGVTTSVLTITNSAGLNGYLYRAKFTNTKGNVTSNEALLTFNIRPTSVISGTQTICNGSTSSNLSIALTGSQPWNLTYTDGTTPVNVTGITSSPYTFTVSPTSSSTYTVSALSDAICTSQSGDRTGSAVVTVSNNNTWTGSVSTVWTNAANWSCGVIPASVSNVTISTATFYPEISSNVTINTLTLDSGTSLKVNSLSGLTVTDVIVNNGTLTVENNADLIQINNVTNTGSGIALVKRNSNPIIRLDYTMWSSPVSGQGLYSFSPFTFANRFYVYNTTTNLFGNSVGFNITGLNGSGVNGVDNNSVPFGTGIGYLIRLPFSHPTAPAIWTGTFTGMPNNGTKTVTLNNVAAGQRFNLVGNPYPSPIDIAQFATDNSSNIESTLYFWRKTNNTANPSYCTWNTASSTYGDNGEAYTESPLGIIRTGQGFIVEAKGLSTTVEFNNGQRIADNANQFFRNNSNATNTNNEAHRIWLNLTGAVNEFSQTVVGYFTNATQGADEFDSKYFNDGAVVLNTIIGSTEYVIQGRALPFQTVDVVPLNFKVTNAGTYTFTIDHVDGLFTAGAQDIFIKDNLNGTYNNLTTSAYVFTSDAGIFADRFEVLYQLPLGVGTPIFNANQVTIHQNVVKDFVINTGNIVMSNVKVFDIRGRLILDKKGINNSQTTINVGQTNEVLLVQITSQDGLVVTKKIIR